MRWLLALAALVYGMTVSPPVTVWRCPETPPGPHDPVTCDPITVTAKAEWGDVTMMARDLYNKPLPGCKVRVVGVVVGAHIDYIDVWAGSYRTARIYHGLGRMYPPRGSVVIGIGSVRTGRADVESLTVMRP